MKRIIKLTELLLELGFPYTLGDPLGLKQTEYPPVYFRVEETIPIKDICFINQRPYGVSQRQFHVAEVDESLNSLTVSNVMEC